MGMDGGGGGKLPYSYAGAGHHQDGKLVKSFSRVEPRKFGMGLVAGFLLVTCAYFSTAKFDAIHIAMGKPRSARRIKRPPGPSAAFPSLSPNLSECRVLSARAVSPISTDAAGIGPLATAAADTSKQQLGEPSANPWDLQVQIELPAALLPWAYCTNDPRRT